MGNRLLTALAGLFVSNSNEDIRIEFTALEPGFQVKDSKVKVWKTPLVINFIITILVDAHKRLSINQMPGMLLLYPLFPYQKCRPLC